MQAPKEKQQNCVVDCRVSDDIQLKGGSLDDQEKLGRLYAERHGWNVARVFKKSHSATTTERDDIDAIIAYIKNSKVKIDHYVFKCIDRFTRAGYPEYERMKAQLESLNVQVWDAYGIIQPKKNTLAHLGNFEYPWSVYSPSEPAEMLVAYQGKQEGRDILTRLIGAEIRLVLEGYSVRRAPDGLVNDTTFVEGKQVVVRKPDPQKSDLFVQMFTLRAQGVDDKEIVERLNAQGFLTRTFKKWDKSDKEYPKIIGKTGGRPLTVKQLQRYIQCTEYAGYTCEKWTHYRPVKMKLFNGIVSVELFNQANKGKVYIKESADGTVQLLRNYNGFAKLRRLKDNPNYPFKFIACPICKSKFLGSASRGKLGKTHPAYHCGGVAGSVRNHKYYRIPKESFEANIKKFADALQFDDDFLASFELVLNDVYRTREKEVVAQSSAMSLNVGNLKAQQANILETLTTTDSPLVRKKLEEKIEELDEKILEAENQRNVIEVTEKDVKAFVRYVKAIMEHPAEILMDTEDLVVQRTLFGLVFNEIPTYQDILNGTPDLSLAFKLSDKFVGNKTQFVTPRRIELRFQE